MMNDQILETIRMIEEEKLDIRTVTMGISLLDCADSDGDVARRNPNFRGSGGQRRKRIS